MWTWIAYTYATMSGLAFAVYGFGKHRAARGGVRVRERTLHLLELLGGWPGALLGQAILRHKRRKLSYMVVFVVIVGLHVAAWAAYLRRG